MKVDENFILREIAGEYILVPVGETAMKIHGMISLSESGYLLYKTLSEGCEKEELIHVLLSEYDVQKDTAENDVESFLEQMRQVGILMEG